MLCCWHLEMSFEQVALHFHFAIGPANYVAGVGICGTWSTNSSSSSYAVTMAYVPTGFWVMKQLLSFCIQLLKTEHNNVDVIRLIGFNVHVTMGHTSIPYSTQPPSRVPDETVDVPGWRWLAQSLQLPQELKHQLYYSGCHGLPLGQSCAGCVPRYITFW